MFIVGIVGNLLVMFVLVFSQDALKSPAGLYSFNLSLANALLIASLPFAADNKLTGYWRFGKIPCKLTESVKLINFFASIFLLKRGLLYF